MIELETYWPGLIVLAIFLGAVHLWFPWFDERFSRHENRWMGFVGGIATGYVTLYLLPKLSRMSVSLINPDDLFMNIGHLQHYLLLLAAIVIYLTMEHLDRAAGQPRKIAQVFDYAVHGAYSFLIGYVLVEISTPRLPLNVMITLILALHLMGMNHLLRGAHQSGYDRQARWIYYLLILLGAGLGVLTELPKNFISSMFAFLAGIILVNVMAEELPHKYVNRLAWYVMGVGCFVAVSFTVVTLAPPASY